MGQKAQKGAAVVLGLKRKPSPRHVMGPLKVDATKRDEKGSPDKCDSGVSRERSRERSEGAVAKTKPYEFPPPFNPSATPMFLFESGSEPFEAPRLKAVVTGVREAHS